jgi:hypothetical protein
VNYAELRQDLQQDGYTIAKDLLPNGLLTKLCQQRDEVLEALSPEHRETYRSQGSLVNMGDHPEFSHLIALPQFQSLIRDLGFTNSRWLAGYLISKPPRSPALFWHQDWWGWDHPLSYTPRMPGLGIMIYLTDTCRENGCLRVIPGSHRGQHPLHDLPVAHEEALSTIEDPNDVAYQCDSREKAVEVTVGDVVLMDPRLLHSAYANKTESERSLITLWYLPDFDELPESIRARYVQIHNRQDLDTGDNAEGKLLDTWPEKHKLALAELEPVYDGQEPPHCWNRAPDQSQMQFNVDAMPIPHQSHIYTEEGQP